MMTFSFLEVGMGDILRMSAKERTALVEFHQVRAGKATLVAAAMRLNKSYRQVRRMYKRFLLEGAKGLLHRSRGRPSNRGFSEGVKQWCLNQYRTRMEGFGPTFAAEKLEEIGAQVNHETLRGWLIEEGLWQRARKRGPHRHWREPKAHFGEMVQMDGSLHDWFEDGSESCLMNMVDDATNVTHARFYEGETTRAAMEMLWSWINRYGIPRTLYTDHDSVYVTNRETTMEEELAGEKPLTAFGKVCKNLGIQIIEADSPQAKGRVERKHGVYQDRFPKDMRFQGIHGMAAGNEWLDKRFLEEMNEKFSHPPLKAEDFHQRVPPGIRLEDVFVWEETRTVQGDWLIRWHSRWFQLLGKKKRDPYSGSQVTVQERLDGSIRIVYRGTEQPYKEIHKKTGLQQDAALEEKTHQERSWPKAQKPSTTHPWNRLGYFKSKSGKRRTAQEATL